MPFCAVVRFVPQWHFTSGAKCEKKSRTPKHGARRPGRQKNQENLILRAMDQVLSKTQRVGAPIGGNADRRAQRFHPDDMHWRALTQCTNHAHDCCKPLAAQRKCGQRKCSKSLTSSMFSNWKNHRFANFLSGEARSFVSNKQTQANSTFLFPLSLRLVFIYPRRV